MSKVIDLIGDIRDKSVEEILREASGEEDEGNISYRGFVYERLWDICIKFGVVDNLTMKTRKTDTKEEHNTCHLFGNLNRDTIEFKPNCWTSGQFNTYLHENIRSGSSSGYSDISFINKSRSKNEGVWIENEDVYFISVKYYEKDKSVDQYDIGKLCTMIEKHQAQYRKIHVLIFVKDKSSLIQKFNAQQRSSDIMMKYIDPKQDKTYPNIYDQKDLEEAIYKLKLLLEQYGYLQDEDSIRRFSEGSESYLQILKSPFIPRFHQKLFIDKINELINDGEKNILVGAIPRSGKSYIMMGSILEYVKVMNSQGNKKQLNFILVTPAPHETFGEYEDIFNTYIDFDTLGINKVLITDGHAARRRRARSAEETKHNIFIVSKQLLGYKENSDAGKDNDSVKQNLDKIREDTGKRVTELLGDNQFDLILLDEAHFGMSTENAQEILNVLDGLGKDTPKMFVTATYNKPLSVYGIDAEKCKLTWDINDVQSFGDTEFDINNNSIKDRFGHEIYNRSLAFFDGDAERIIDSYRMYPKPYLMTSVWDYQYLQQEKGKMDMDSYGFDMDKLFTVKGGNFENIDQMKQMMRYYFGYPDKKLSYGQQHIYRQRGILPRIQKICSGNCRTMQEPNHFTSQLWFLPFGPNRKIVDIVNALITLFKFSEFKDIGERFHFYVAVNVDGGDRDSSGLATYMQNSRNIKSEIQALEKDKHKNIIILAGARLQLGISLRNVDIVTLWNMITSSDAIFQMLFRSMTEVNVPKCGDDDYYCSEKKYGFMVDLNPQRALTNTLLFGDNLSSKKSEGKSKYELVADCINIDEDVFQDKYDTDDPKERKEFVNEMFNKLYSSWNKKVDDIRQLTEKVLQYDEDVLLAIETGLRGVKLSKKPGPKKAPVADSAPPEGFAPGQKGKRTEEHEKEDSKDKETKKEKIPLSKLAAEVISETISLLNIFSLYTSGEDTKCILTSDVTREEVEEERQIKIVGDINQLKEEVFSEHKETFLELLNGRITGDYDNMYDEDLLNMILDSILKKSAEKENNLYAINKLVMSQKKKYYTIKEPAELLEYINANLAPKEKERKQSGEVFTPIFIVEEMLDKLPDHVWSDHTLKWLDPAVGIGNFPICVYLRLMEGLKSWEKDEEKRRKYILEKMLYMVEISKKSIMILNKVFCGDKYKLNIFPKSFFDYKETDFDIIMGNPPYNPPKKEGKSTGNSIWQHFVMKSFYMLKEKGYLVFVHPPGWKKPTNDTFKEEQFLNHKDQVKMQVRQGQVWQVLKDRGSFSFIYTNDQKSKAVEHINHFPAVDFYVYQKGGKRSKCDTKNIFNGQIIESKGVEINYELSFLPVLITDKSQSVLNKVTKDRQNDIKSDFKRGIDERGIKSWEGSKIDWIYDANKNGFQYKKLGENPKTKKEKVFNIVNVNKIVINFGGGIDAYTVKYIRKEENKGVLDMAMFSQFDKNAKQIEKIFNSDLIKFIFHITQYASGKMTKNEPIVANSISIPEGDIGDIYKYYGITRAEQELIDAVVNHVKPTKRTPKKDKGKPATKAFQAEDPKYKGTTPAEEGEEPEPEPSHEPHSAKPSKKTKTLKKKKCDKSSADAACKKKSKASVRKRTGKNRKNRRNRRRIKRTFIK